ncbi:hypothetical protein [Micromonospora costi]|uniref:Uncharacterized protein n=1 Tax=Micromonospora costi TaxID=1530042 RepID=A0A3B0A4X2_9ACTN|nr:hypothetical protein [Micromonospora costi]RKN54367.1 hypothetical protein D7193_20445 [Micromonospora costi]
MSGAVQAEYAPPTGPDASAPKRRRWLLVATVAWALLLGLLAWISVRDDAPTVREQRSLAEAGPRVDAAVGELVTASGPAVLELIPARVERGCRLTPLADGATLTRDVEAVGAAGAERELLEGIADRLPASWRAGVRLTPDGVRLRADAGEFVSVEGRPTADGRVRLTVETGCRPVGTGYTSAGGASAGGAGGAEMALAGALRALGDPADTAPELVTAPCPGGGVARTARSATGGGAATAATALAPLATGGPVLDTPEAYAYRTGGVVVLADTAPGHPHVSATTPCP